MDPRGGGGGGGGGGGAVQRCRRAFCQELKGAEDGGWRRVKASNGSHDTRLITATNASLYDNELLNPPKHKRLLVS